MEAGALIQQGGGMPRRGGGAEGRPGLRAARPEGTLPLVEGSEAMLQRAVNVLVDNAVCYTPAGGHVRIIRGAAGARTSRSASRTTAPASPRNTARAFSSASTAQKKAAQTAAHSGLGLSVARSIAASHGGKVTYDPVKPHGSRFSIVLPGVEGGD